MIASTQADSVRPAILVVEDSTVVRNSLVSWLEFRFPECRVLWAESAETALEEIARLAPNVVLMDIDLPGIDGIEATRRVKSRSPGTAVVMITMHDTPLHRRAAADAGAVSFVPKNELERLHTVLERLVRARGGHSR